jgi:hypothetical protein
MISVALGTSWTIHRAAAVWVVSARHAAARTPHTVAWVALRRFISPSPSSQLKEDGGLDSTIGGPEYSAIDAAVAMAAAFVESVNTPRATTLTLGGEPGPAVAVTRVEFMSRPPR